MKVTAEQVRDAVAAAGIKQIDHHDCSGCGYMTAYLVHDGRLYFDAGCDCSRYGRAEPRPADWEEAADWINMQKPEWAAKLAARFGVKL